ncbi:LysR family transcriptional regulator [Jannaschia sp. S6380]|uniref:LysR family transcriptional regulator n=1 Tax=Jannaschia sp. S6380 TaxID=2926408 RepID=UPI001FF4691D|nr:LysR family transcriptional regulator [Jannaschia sp. S6380]MCK0167211.1 LysR family transcriptional regulator [Jannaschia sp. S6380]
MRPEALRGFQLVIERGSLAAAADLMHMSEPALSRLIAGLERDLNLVLFDRSRRRLQPTAIGRAFLQEVQPVLSGLSRIEDYAEELRNGVRRRLRLVSMPRLSAAITAPVVAEFSRTHPDVVLTVDIQPRRFLETWITGQRFDLGLSTMPAHHRDIDTRLLMEVPAMVVLPRGHRLAGAAQLAVEDLAGERILALGPGALMRQQMSAIYDRANQVLVPAVEVSQANLVCHLVALGAGVTICDPLSPMAFADDVVTVPVAPYFPVAFGMHFLRGQELSEEARDLVDITHRRAETFLRENGLTDLPT